MHIVYISTRILNIPPPRYARMLFSIALVERANDSSMFSL